MDYNPPSEIVQLGIEAAKELLGDDAQVRLTVETGVDSTDEPAYWFSFQIRKGKVFEFPPGLFRIRLIQGLIDKLSARGDTHYPLIERLVVTDWAQAPDA